MDAIALRWLVDVARRGSFAAAARDRDADPSSVSRIIAALEDELGIRLFQRSTRRMTLTEAGELYLARIEPLLDELDRALTDASDVSAAPAGTLRLSASVTFGHKVIVPLLGPFRELYPALRLEAKFDDANLDLVAERIDLAIRLAPVIEGDLVASRLMATRYRVIASPGYLSRQGPIVRPADIAAHRCLLFPIRAFRTRWSFRDAAGTVEDVAIQGDIVLSPASALFDAALAGLGIALLPDWLVEDAIADGRLVRLFPERSVTATSFETAAWIVYPSRAYLPSKVRVMIDFLRSRLAQSSSVQGSAARAAAPS